MKMAMPGAVPSLPKRRLEQDINLLQITLAEIALRLDSGLKTQNYQQPGVARFAVPISRFKVFSEKKRSLLFCRP